MEKEKLIKLGLTEEQADKVIAEHKAQLEGNYIPKSRFDDVNNAKKKLEKDIAERDKQLKTLKEDTNTNEELKTIIEKLEADNKAANDDYKKEIAALKLNAAIESTLLTQKAKNIKAVKSLLDISKISLENENLSGLEEQIKVLKEAEDSKFLFEVEAKADPKTPAGATPGASNIDTGSDTKNMSYEQLAEYMEANPGIKL
ncbi:Phage minor structural protein GP20 [Sebaldella termitidis]|uniref:Minor structural GP20 protein n=1 Tax=Sebaldella termitidis (strain ATCC 33386 / NCTC 11300) TaxID=526218 RepID=D1AHQ8_SEBTE|nr:phage scaffolding protein [Sebaldella termitidis]ACZ08292.1 minor structural GP20 protein [Sebaldella termitidis ATCC 33386]SUI23602.1 Phage minor structural protein GP20 [Sebaldella termitidis]